MRGGRAEAVTDAAADVVRSLFVFLKVFHLFHHLSENFRAVLRGIPVFA